MGFYANYTCDDDRRTARILVVLLGASLVLYLMSVYESLLWHDRRTFLATLAAGAVLVVALWLLRRGHLRTSSLLFILSVLSLVTAICTFGEGVHDPTIMVYPIIVLFLGLTLPGSAFGIGIALTLASMGWLVFGEEVGLILPDPYQRPNWIYFMIMGAILLVGALAVDLLAANLRRNLRLARQELVHRKQVEEALRESEDRYRSIVEQSLIGIGVSKGNQVRFANQGLLRIFGYEDLEDLRRVPLMDLVAPASRELIAGRMRMAAEGIRAPDEFEYEIVTKSGQTKTLLASSAHLSWEGETCTHTTFQDITERRRTEEALRASQVQLAAAMDLADLVNWEFDVDTGIFTFNDRFYALYGTTAALEGGYQMPAEVYAKTFVHPDEQHVVAQEVNKAIQASDPDYRSCLEHRIVRRDGEIRHVVVRFGVTKDEQGRTIKTQGANQDITVRKRAELEKEELQVQLLQAQKMETVGRLAGGIAHDFNNLLTAVIGNSDLILQTMAPDDPNRELVADVKEVGERAAGLTRQILAFSRRQVLKPQVLNVNEIVVGMEPLFRRTLGEDVVLHLALEPDLQQTEVDRDQMGQVLMNLVINARDAMPEGGLLTIETANVTLDSAYSETNPEAKPGRYAMLAVTDSGCGMDAETRSRIFEPFFTTKEVGKGTGLGLSTVFGIVEQSGGSISTYSEPGRGSTFKIYLPAIPAKVALEADSPAEEEPKRGAETILLVEDEDSVRQLVTRILSRAGYRLLGAGSAPELDTVLANDVPAPDLLLTDVVLPGGANGRDVAEMLLARYPDLRVIFMSGYTRDSVVHNGRLDEGIEFLEKPFTPEVLLRKVRAVLDAGAREAMELAASRTG